ncbi:MAG TPA: two-component regulator propeller domain-containing protein, partial [Bacteroidia bacterium]|nr:two-component regulator propeller domain-containing protein [Bacteroidia bacterium]
MNNFTRIISFIFLLALNPLFSQQLRFKHITSEDGLSTNYITCIMQDDLGFMWFGSQDGLNKYYGTGIQNPVKIFKKDPTNKNSLSNSEITALAQVRQDLILVGTREGLNFFNPVTEKFTRPQKADSKKDPKVNVILRLDSANAMIGTESGLYAINLNSRVVKNYFFKGANKVNVNCIEKINGTYYIGTEGDGLWSLDKNNQLNNIKFTMPDLVKIPLEELTSITRIEKYGRTMYLGTDGYGIFKVDSRTFEVEVKIPFPNLYEGSGTIKNFVVRNNKIFAATKLGLIAYNLISDEIEIYAKGDQSFSMNNNHCTTVFIDNESNFWVGTDLGGVNVSFFQSLKFPNSSTKKETEFDNVYSFYEQQRDDILLGSVKTLHEVNLKTGKAIGYSNILKSATVLSIEKESENIVWIGTWGSGIYRYDKSTGKAQNFLSKELGGTIVCLKISGNHIYAGSVGDGLFKINLENFDIKNFGVKDGLPNQSINNIFIDSKKNVWLATYDGGLVKMKSFDKNGKLPIEKIYNNTGKTNQIASNIVFGVNEDKHGRIWAATATGLSKLID